jgi:ORF6N domain
MNSKETLAIVPRIFAIRCESVMLDSDLAALYGVETKQFNRSIQRNLQRFPADFAFQLTRQEFINLKYQFGTSSSHGGRRTLPLVFTEHGAIMAATTLNSERAVVLTRPLSFRL